MLLLLITISRLIEIGGESLFHLWLVIGVPYISDNICVFYRAWYYKVFTLSSRL
nr:MAG TPA: hypothetical protein [Caudoviricetes sp.]